MTTSSLPKPSSKPLPVAGFIDFALRDRKLFTHPLEATRTLYSLYGPVVMHKLGSWRTVNMFGPDANGLVLQNRDGIFSNKLSWDMIIGRVFPNGLMLRDGDDHRQHRRIMQAGFKKPALVNYLAMMNPIIDQRLGEMSRPDNDVSAFKLMKLLTLELAWNVFVGTSAGQDTHKLTHAFEETVAASMAPLRIALPPFLLWRGIRSRQYLVDYFAGLLPEKRRSLSRDMFSILANAEGENGEKYSDQEILDHMVFLMMAAHDTTTSTLSSMLYALGKMPEWQERLREEVRALGKSAIDFDDQDRLPLMTLVMKEALRRYPPLPDFPKMNTQAFEFDGFQVPADCMCVLHPIHTHHMEEYWREPFRFDPERFSDARAEHKQHPFLWVPFSSGAHMCIGLHFAEMQIKAILAQLLQRFSWRLPDDYVMPVQQSPISKPKDGLPLILKTLS
ncbi:MAG TPA: cytochrome P450 [Dongiaceae bacterium]|nr:cytochrome P450 [Dongiaceae bacterium]